MPQPTIDASQVRQDDDDGLERDPVTGALQVGIGFGIQRAGDQISWKETVDSLSVSVNETSFDEVVRDGNGRASSVITWTSSGKTLKIREEIYTRTSGRISQVVYKQYDGSGNVTQTLTETVTRSSGRIASITRTRS